MLGLIVSESRSAGNRYKGISVNVKISHTSSHFRLFSVFLSICRYFHNILLIRRLHRSGCFNKRALFRQAVL